MPIATRINSLSPNRATQNMILNHGKSAADIAAQKVNTVIRGRGFEVAVAGWTQYDIDNFNKFNDKLTGIYTELTLQSRLNPYLTAKEQKIAQDDADTAFMNTFMKGMAGRLEPTNALELGQMIMRDVNIGLKMGAERYLSTGACKLYVRNAAEIEKAQLAMIREETAIGEIKVKLDALKEQHKNAESTEEKNKIAKEHNELAKIHDTHVEVYNSILTDTYEPLAKIQNKLWKDIKNKLLQGNHEATLSLLGKAPRLPKQKL